MVAKGPVGLRNGRWSRISSSAVHGLSCSRILALPGSCGCRGCRGGTALNTLHRPGPMRSSEDIAVVRTTAGPIGPILSRMRDVPDPWLGQRKLHQSAIAPKFKYAIEGEDTSPLRLKIEISTREQEAFDTVQLRPFTIGNLWFSGSVDIATFSTKNCLRPGGVISAEKPEGGSISHRTDPRSDSPPTAFTPLPALPPSGRGRFFGEGASAD